MLPDTVLDILMLTILAGWFTAYGSIYLTMKTELVNFSWNPWTVKSFFVRLILIHIYIMLHQVVLSLISLGISNPVLIPEILGFIFLVHMLVGLVMQLFLLLMIEIITYKS